MSFDSLIFLDNSTIGWGVGMACVFIFGILLGYKVAKWHFSKQIKKRANWMTASQVRDIYRQMGRTPTEKQIKQMLATANNTTN